MPREKHANGYKLALFRKKCHFKSVAIHPNNKKPYQLYTYSETIINFSSVLANYSTLQAIWAKLPCSID